MKNHIDLPILAILGLCLFFSGCDVDKKAPVEKVETEVSAKVIDTRGRELGVVTFKTVETGTLVNADLRGLGPNQTHGFHIHENGICEGDFESAGDHFNPTGLPHGSPGEETHAGDLGNVTSDAEGNANYSYVSQQFTVDATSNGIIGKTVILHSGEDDLKTQPAGDAGWRMGCGVISITGSAYSE